MENASKALLIAAEILVGVLILTLMATIFLTFTDYHTQVTDNYKAKEINQFNIQFLIYEGRKDLTAQDVVTIYNLAENYNSKFEGEKEITIKLNGQPFKENQYEYLKNNLQSEGTYTINPGGIKTNSLTGKVKEINILKNN